MPAAHDIYAEQLSELRRGFPLYYPEPASDDGPMQIGDVRFLRQGAFHRLFNVSRSREDPAQRFGVPEGFERLDLGVIRSYDAALEPGPLHSKTVFTLNANVGAPGVVLPMDASFRFQCTSKRGAILMQETQMNREEAVQTQLFEDYLQRHCQSWYDCARENHIPLGFGQIMLVTECSKTAAWSSAVYSNSVQEFGVSFSVGNAFVPCAANVSASASMERTGPIERRRSAQRPSPTPDSPQPQNNHTAFFKALHLGTRQAYIRSLISLFMKIRNSKTVGLPDKFPEAPTSDLSMADSRPYAPSPSSPSFNEYLIGIAGKPELPDFHPVSPLLARMMENTDVQCAIIHDNEWCSPVTGASQIIEEYVRFHFDDCDDLMHLSLEPETEVYDEDMAMAMGPAFFDLAAFQAGPDPAHPHSQRVPAPIQLPNAAAFPPAMIGASPKNTIDWRECPHCGKKFSRPSALKAHMALHTSTTWTKAHSRVYKCSAGCQKRFTYRSRMEKHVRDVHSRRGVNNENEANSKAASYNSGAGPMERGSSTEPEAIDKASGSANVASLVRQLSVKRRQVRAYYSELGVVVDDDLQSHSPPDSLTHKTRSPLTFEKAILHSVRKVDTDEREGQHNTHTQSLASSFSVVDRSCIDSTLPANDQETPWPPAKVTAESE
ncbi:hypothetical protein DXG01_007515 [Tephrocybe rancida]|nr:hypothetical protein DXG01_007515 [Tephrocybe rancida]